MRDSVGFQVEQEPKEVERDEQAALLKLLSSKKAKKLLALLASEGMPDAIDILVQRLKNRRIRRVVRQELSRSRERESPPPTEKNNSSRKTILLKVLVGVLVYMSYHAIFYLAAHTHHRLCVGAALNFSSYLKSLLTPQTSGSVCHMLREIVFFSTREMNHICSILVAVFTAKLVF